MLKKSYYLSLCHKNLYNQTKRQLLQYKCGTDEWQEVTLPTSKGYCGYQPITSVTCRVRAMNSAGWSTAIDKTVYTKCTSED